jgi:hypothetical protein
VLLPAVLTGVWRAKTSDRPLWPIALIAGVALIEVFRSVNVMSPFYLWSTPAWLGLYLYATHGNAMEAAAPDPYRTEANESGETLPKQLPGAPFA